MSFLQKGLFNLNDVNGLEEKFEAIEAIANGDTVNAVEECFDAIAVLLRVIDVLEGRQKIDNPEVNA